MFQLKLASVGQQIQVIWDYKYPRRYAEARSVSTGIQAFKEIRRAILYKPLPVFSSMVKKAVL